MKTKYTLLSFTAIVLIAAGVFFYLKTDSQDVQLTDMEAKRAKHAAFFKSSPYAATVGMSREDRKAQGLPPNAYNERMWELTMNPELGYPTPYLVEPIDILAPVTNSVPGNAIRPWEERGPNNVGGRTRVIFYDPNDVGANNGDGVDYNRVFAGGVGGGLWVNDDITDVGESWTLVPGVAANLNVQCFAIDPNNPQVMYIGTGEQYTSGAAVGNGLYKSTDGGATWNSVNLPIAGGGTLNGGATLFTSGLYYINDIEIWDNNGTSELYVGVGAAIYFSPNFNISNPTNILGLQNAGLYKSTDAGNNWNRVETPALSYSFSGQTLYVIPNDFEIGADNTLYFGTVGSPGTGEGGGRIYSTSNGTTWTLERVVGASSRVEIGASATNPNLFYVLTQASGSQGDVYRTIDGFATLPRITEPNDADLGIPANDFTRGQAFYDLVVEVDPTDDQIVYAGGIDLFRSTNGGNSWTQISKWSNNANLNTLNVPFIHADIHALTFNPTDSNQAVIGSDGGVSWAQDLASAQNNPNVINNRNNGYNTTQFYYGSIAQSTTVTGLIGGAQDNGTQAVIFPTSGENSFTPIQGGDGGHTAIDSDDGYVILTFQFNNHQRYAYPSYNFRYCINGAGNCGDNSDGDFINVAELDMNNDYFFSNSRLNGSQNAIEACELLPNSSNCNLLTNGLINGSRPTAMKASPFATGGSTTLFVGTETSRLIKVENANTTTPNWTNISGINFLGSVSDIEFGDTEQEIFVTMHNYGVQNIWYTQDGGATWVGKEGNLPDLPVKSILKNPLLPNEVMIGTEMGIYATGNFDAANPNWVPQINGMTNVKVLDLDLRTADNTILATTHGRGMFTGTFDTLSLSEENLNDRINVYPTVVENGIITVEQDLNQPLEARIFNLSGAKLLESTIDEATTELQVDNLKSGFYILHLQGNGVDRSVKFTVR